MKQISATWNVARRAADLAVIVMLLGCAQRGSTTASQTPATAARPNTASGEADRLDKAVNTLLEKGQLEEALPLAQRSLALREQDPESRPSDLAKSLDKLGELHLARGEFAQAESLLVRALDLREKALGPTHPAVAETLTNLGGLYYEQGAYAGVEPLWTRALEINQKTRGAMHPDVAASLNLLGQLYRAQGAYARAEPLLIRALDIQEKVLGPMHPLVAQTLNNIALLYDNQGAYARAEPLLLRALEIREKVLGAMHPVVAVSLSNLGYLYLEQDAYAQAEPLLIRALDITEKTLGAMHPHTAIRLNNLASVYFEQGDYARGEPLQVRALEIDRQVLGPMHAKVATDLNNLGMVHYAQGAYARAEPLLVQALDINERAWGAMHPEIAVNLNNLATVYQAQGAHERAELLLERVAELREANLRVELAPLSESRKRDLMLGLQREAERLISLQAHSMPTSRQALELALTTVLRRKGRVLDSLADTQAMLRAHLTPQLRDKLSRLANTSALLSSRLRAPFEPRAAERQKAEIASLRAQIDKLDGDLNAASVEFRAQSEPVMIARIQDALPRGAALVEFVRYRRYDARQGLARRRWQEAHYLAYILPWQGPAQWIALGDAARIEAGIDAALAAMRKDAGASVAKAALRNLDALVLAPIRDRLTGISHVILSPDGKLNLVPFEALIDPQGHYALEQRLMSYVTSGRDLLRFAARQASRSPAMIVADPDYGPPGKPYVRVDGTLAETYGRLSGTLAEADGIRRYFPDVKTLIQGQATKAALIAAVGPSVLHVATHGFYTHAAAASPGVPVRRERGISAIATAPLPPPPPSEDPTLALDRAGLVLAGANLGPEGIVSARELAGRDWWGTQLVVLSACGTGVGEVPSGEGVYGLRRALVLAGARSQVVSLWNVNDSSAPELMRELYAELARGTGRAEALRRAKLHILQQPRFAHPYYWAGVIPAGDWTPLDDGVLLPAGAGPATPPMAARPGAGAAR